MIDDSLMPILQASKTVKVFMKDDSNRLETPSLTHGCYDCEHTVPNMSTERDYYNLEFGYKDIEDLRYVPLIAFTVAFHDQWWEKANVQTEPDQATIPWTWVARRKIEYSFTWPAENLLNSAFRSPYVRKVMEPGSVTRHINASYDLGPIVEENLHLMHEEFLLLRTIRPPGPYTYWEPHFARLYEVEDIVNLVRYYPSSFRSGHAAFKWAYTRLLGKNYNTGPYVQLTI